MARLNNPSLAAKGTRASPQLDLAARVLGAWLQMKSPGFTSARGQCEIASPWTSKRPYDCPDTTWFVLACPLRTQARLTAWRSESLRRI